MTQTRRSFALWGLGFVCLLGLAYGVSDYLARQWVRVTRPVLKLARPLP